MARACAAGLAVLAFLGGAQAGNVSLPTVEIAPGVRIPVMSIGTGGLESVAAQSIVSIWLGLGGRGLDTAFIYKNQDSVRKAMAVSGLSREDIFITTKIPGCLDAKQYVESDLQQLGVSYIDLLLIHYPGPDASHCQATWAALEEYHAQGVLKSIGVSNFKTQDLQSLLQTARVRPAVNQIQHNVLLHDDATIAFCRANNITVEAYSPLGRDGHSGDIPDNKVIQAIAANHKVSTYQVALKWILQHGIILTFQSASAEHQACDADVFSFELTEQEMAQLDQLQSALPAPELVVV